MLSENFFIRKKIVTKKIVGRKILSHTNQCLFFTVPTTKLNDIT